MGEVPLFPEEVMLKQRAGDSPVFPPVMLFSSPLVLVMTNLTLGEKLGPELRGTEGFHAGEDSGFQSTEHIYEHLLCADLVLGAGDVAKYTKSSDCILVGRQTIAGKMCFLKMEFPRDTKTPECE